MKARRLGKQRLPKDEWRYFGDEMGVFKDEYKKNELRHSRGAPHTNHIINNTKTNNQTQR